eukprot:GHVT01089842.1.p1 GENE.GHVT01089842.1~~GHVT01089842.1.p1  ORF type:complete len:182 (+),score=36.62 GHVT01089842.1:151-696(+)
MSSTIEEVKVDMTRMTVAHAHVIVLDVFKSFLSILTSGGSTASFLGAPSSPSVLAACLSVLKSLYCIYAYFYMEESLGQFLSAGVVPLHVDGQPFAEVLQQQLRKHFKLIRPHVVVVADAFALPDYLLNSVLGRYDGQVYQALLAATKDEPLNRTDVHEGYYRHIQYILHPERRQEMHSRL